MKNSNSSKVFGRVFYLLLICFTIFAVLDVFYISRSYGDASGDTGDSAVLDVENATITDSSYDDGNVSITLSTSRVKGTDIHIADVVLSSPEYLKTAFAKNTYGKNIIDTTSDMADEHGAMLAINGDYYGVQNDGYVVRNGTLYRSAAAAEDRQDMAVLNDGTMEIVSESKFSAQELVDNGAVQVFSFGPALIDDGLISVGENDEVDLAKTSNPRTAIGMISPLHYVFLVSDGRTDESEGLTLYELACFMRSCGVVCAYNLDGGGSSTMVFNGNLVNDPTSDGVVFRERNVSDIVYIG
ncbi:MAG: phosphodiester glycosidase family protein [Oscillospiraceae bacterium]|nr:phosphodiester glycosidase family protein [Oscillospiraceae bacterium]